MGPVMFHKSQHSLKMTSYNSMSHLDILSLNTNKLSDYDLHFFPTLTTLSEHVKMLQVSENIVSLLGVTISCVVSQFCCH